MFLTKVVIIPFMGNHELLFFKKKLRSITMLLKTKKLIILIASTGMLLVLLNTSSYAIPTFSRQTNMPCSSCHYTYPELTPFGRLFKLNGYTLTGIATIQSTYKEKTNLNLLKTFPLSATIQSSYTSISKAPARSEERRVGKECRSRWSPYH